MEQKTIGQFIATLRKANGLTQKDLAERLHVSDKAVSRWERDETAPDISLLPVIAEVFNVTADELLRGEKTPVGIIQERDTHSNQRTEKQMKRLLDSRLNRLKSQLFIVCGIALLGVAVAALCNTAFLKAMLGFWLALSLLLADAVMLAIFAKNAFAAVRTDEFEESAILAYRTAAYRATANTCCLLVPVFAACTPLLLSGGAYTGISFDTWVSYGAPALLLGAVVCCIGRFAAERLALSKNWILPAPKRKNLKRAVCVLAVTVPVMLLTFVGQIYFNENAVTLLTKGHRFTNYDDFKQFMENPDYSDRQYADAMTRVAPIEDPDGTAEEPDGVYPHGCRETILAEDGSILCEYTLYPEYTPRYDYGKPEDGYLPITVYTSDDFTTAYRVSRFVNLAWILLYLVEGSAALTCS